MESFTDTRIQTEITNKCYQFKLYAKCEAIYMIPVYMKQGNMENIVNSCVNIMCLKNTLSADGEHLNDNFNWAFYSDILFF